MKRLLFATAGLSLALCLPAHAETAVDELVITATRLPALADEVTGARVITRDEIEARQAVFATDLLPLIPGLSLARNGGFGGIATLRIRGAGPDKTLVLIDGAPVNDASDPNGAYDFSSLQLGDIERVEVLSGPQSSLWGSDAIGGVVSLTSRELDGWRAELEGGSQATVRGALAAGFANDAGALGASLSAYRSDGVSKADRRDGATEKDGFKTVTAALNGRIAAGERLTVAGNLRYSEADIDLDGFPAPNYLLGDTSDTATSRTWSGAARARLTGALGLDQTFSASAYDVDRKTRSDFPSHYQGDRQVYRWTAGRGDETDALSFILGAEREDSHADLDGRIGADAGASSVFGVVRGRPGTRITATASLRYDAPDDYRDKLTGRVSLAGELAPGVTLTGSVGTGFKAPTVSQIVCDFCYAPPVALTPEKATGYDLRLAWRSTDQRFDAALTGYRLTVRDQIVYIDGRYANIARTRGEGVEAEASAALTDALRLKLAYALTESEDRSTGLQLLRVPRHSGAASLLYDTDRWDAAFTVRAESAQADTARDGFSRLRRDGFAVADLAVGYALNERVKLTARLENIADTRYQETFGYGEAGRTLLVGVRLRN